MDIEKFKGLKIDINYNEIIQRTSKEVSEAIRDKALQTFTKDASGEYARSWTYKIEKDYGDKVKGVVYNDKHAPLTHLLENGHDVMNQKNGNVIGHAAPHPHIKPVFDAFKDVYIKEMAQATYEIKGE